VLPEVPELKPFNQAFFLALLVLGFHLPAFAQPTDIKRQLAAMELTLFSKTFCKDTPIRRIERIEENFTAASDQKEKDLRTRLNELLDKVQPSSELLQKPDPCEGSSKKGGRSLFNSIMTGMEVQGRWKQREYPFIDWGGRGILGLEKEKATGFLKTDYDSRQLGYVKYDFIVKLPERTYPPFFTITLLDDHGFKLSSFTINGSMLTKVPTADGSTAWQLKDHVRFRERDYKDARDITVTANY
jgi:hypothetical protein